ncbi:MAG: DUF2748 family protein [Rickettsiaceae bacterium]|nr:DUF2748 family protein [Rickettsiaceae bacterium]
MSSNLYHVLYKMPAYKHEDMLQEYEEIATELYKSGRVRIDTDDKCNFARLVDPSKNISLMFSYQEIYDDALITKTKNRLAKIYGKESNKISASIKNLKDQLKRLIPVDEELAMNLIRIIVQSAQPIVMKWFILEEVELFISYSHNIGDMMDISGWRVSGSNSGMQSTDGKNVAVFVSAGGNPFLKNEDENAIYGDGKPAIARMQIIAGQELGHYSDIKRDHKGQQIGRHSANFSCTKATPHIKKARRDDISVCEKIQIILRDCGIDRLAEYEREIIFYRNNKLRNLALLYNIIMSSIYRFIFILRTDAKGLDFARLFKTHKYMATDIKDMVDDMLFNLQPEADVYKNGNPEVEEAIACVEALARVPQQVMKWGYVTTKTMMSGLYEVYYGEVIPSLIECWNALFGVSYKRNYEKVHVPLIDRIMKIVRGD